MKKIFYAIAFLCVSTFAATPAVQCNPNDPSDPNAPCSLGTEYCYNAVAGNGAERRCITTGYICHIGINPARDGGADAMYFFVSSSPACNQADYFLTGDNEMKTCLFNDYKDASNQTHTDISDSPYTKFFLNNDTHYAGPLAMTVTGSFALSAYNHSNKVQIIYAAGGTKRLDTRQTSATANQQCLVEHSGIRVLALSVIK